MRAFRNLALGSLLVPSVALAQEAQTASDPLQSPGFVTMDRHDQNSRVGGELSYLFYDTPDGVDATGLRFDIHGHYVDKASGFGGYLSIPIGFYSFDSPGDDQSETAVGNVELGGLWTKQVADLLGLVVRGGIVLPTLTDGDGRAAVQATLFPRITDAIQAFPKAAALRLAVSPIIRAGKVFARGDLGFDLVFSEPDGVDYDNLVRFNAGVGYDGGSFAVGGELTLVSADESSTNVALFSRFKAGPASPYLALVIPLDEEISDVLNLAITAGVDVNIN